MALKNPKTTHIVLLTESFGFPNGMAATQRARLLFSCLAKDTFHVLVVCYGLSDTYTQSKNKEIKGKYEDIPFLYTTGVTSRPKGRIANRLVGLRGLFGAMRLIWQLKSHNEVDIVYLWSVTSQLNPSNLVLIPYLKLLKIPVACEINEQPWTVRSNSIWLDKIFPPLTGINGMISISDYLSSWIDHENIRRKRKTAYIQVPILVNVNEFKLPEQPSADFRVLIACSPAYDQTIRFILEAMKPVWQEHPDCKLVITGGDQNSIEGQWMRELINNPENNDRIKLTGYLSREELLEEYSHSSALLIPMFDDGRSKARFPTKIGEYLASGRPLITNYVGEVGKFLIDGQNAFVCEPGNSLLFGEKINQALANPEASHRIGRMGRELAKLCFHYEVYANTLSNFFEQVSKS